MEARAARARGNGLFLAGLILPGYGLLFLFVLAPLGLMLVTSLATDLPGGGRHINWTLANYAQFFSASLYANLTARSLGLGAAVTALCLVLALPVAYGLARVFRHRHIFLLLLMIPFWSASLLRAYSWVTVLQDGGPLQSVLQAVRLIGPDASLMDNQGAVIVALVHVYFPYMVLTLYSTMERIDGSLLEAARNLGAGPLRTFGGVVLPLSLPGIIAGCILVFIPAVGSFVEPRILGGTGSLMIGTIIDDQFNSTYNPTFGAALSFILLLVVLVVLAGATRALALAAGRIGGA
ncbi:MAG: ABC transporter permease [Chloroflexota bacterium]